jgi:hypothetical protein
MTVDVLGQVFVFLHLSESARRMVFLDGHIASFWQGSQLKTSNKMPSETWQTISL